MEQRSLKTNLKQGLETLGDLYALGDANLYPLFDRLHYHLHEISSQKEKLVTVKEFSSLRKVFLKEVENQIKEFFRTKPCGQLIDVIDELNDPGLDTLDKIVDCFPVAGKVCDLFSFEGKITVSLANDNFSFKGKVPFDMDFEELREETYRLTRLFLKKEVLFTFNVFETGDSNTFNLEFNFHFNTTGMAPYLIQVNKETVLSLSPIVKTFSRPMADLEKVGEHSVFLIDEDLVAKKMDRFSFLKCIQDQNYHLFHFPFLFRPISLIIKRSNFGGKGTIEAHKLGPFQDEANLRVLELDLFKIFQK